MNREIRLRMTARASTSWEAGSAEVKVPQVVVGIRLEGGTVRQEAAVGAVEAVEAVLAVEAVEAAGKAEEGTPRHRCCPIR